MSKNLQLSRFRFLIEKYLFKAFPILMQVITFSANIALSQEVEAPADSTPTFMIDAVVITADRASNSIANSTSAISLLTAEEIAQIPARTLCDAIQLLPGFFILSKDGLGRDPILSTRGFYGGGEAEYVQVLVDGRQVNDMETGLVDWNLVPLQNISSIEISRTPSSPLYGDAALGGVINILTRKNTLARQALFLRGGTHGSLDAGVQSQGVWSTIPYQLSISSERTNGFRTHVAWQGSTLNGSILFTPASSSTLRLSTLDQWTRGDDPGPLTASDITTDRQGSSPYYKIDGNDNRRYLADADFSWAITGGSTLEADLFYKNKGSNVIRTFTSPPVIIDPASGSIIGIYDTSSYGDTKERELRTSEAGVSLQYTLSSAIGGIRNRLTTGLEGNYGRLRSSYFAQFKGFRSDYEQATIGRGELLVGGDGIRRKYAFYVNDEVRLIDPLTLTVGARFDGITDSYGGTTEDTSLSADHSLVSPKIGVNFHYLNSPEFGGNLYVTANRSFKAATFDQLTDQRPIDAGVFIPIGGGRYTFAPVSVPPFSNSLLRPQKSTNIEAGIYQRGQFTTELYGELSLAAYLMDVTDEIDFDLKTFRYQNIQETRHAGVEVGSTIHIPGGISALFNYTQTSVKFRSGSNTDHYLKAIPRNLISLGAMYRHKSGITAGITWKFVRDVYLDDENSMMLPDYHTASAKLSYAISPVTVFVNVENVLNRLYNSTGYILYGDTFYYPSAGRTASAGLSIEF